MGGYTGRGGSIQFIITPLPIRAEAGKDLKVDRLFTEVVPQLIFDSFVPRWTHIP